MTRHRGSIRCLPDWPELVMKAMPGTMNELAARTGQPKATIKDWALTLRRCGWAHVTGWTEPGPGPRAPILKAGPGKDKPRPPKMTKSEVYQRYTAKARMDGRYQLTLRRWKFVRRAERRRKSSPPATPFDAILKGFQL